MPNAVPYLFTALQDRRAGVGDHRVRLRVLRGLQNGLGSRIVGNIALSNNAEAWAYVLGACLLGLAFFLSRVALERVVDAGRGRAPGAGWGMMSHPSGTQGRGSAPGGRGIT